MHWKKYGALLVCFYSFVSFAEQDRLPNTQPLTLEGDLAAQMVEGIDRFLMREIESSIEKRQQFWKRDFSSRDAYEKSIQPNREHLRKMIGAIDDRDRAKIEFVSSPESPAKIAETKTYDIFAVRWPVFKNVFGEGLWIKQKPQHHDAFVVVIPDADQTPEMLAGLAPGLKEESQIARRLAENGYDVFVPTIISREDTFSGNPKLNRFTNQPHREWIYRQSYELGRHIIGYEVQKVLAAIDFALSQQSLSPGNNGVGVAGYGEGGLLALYAAALDPRIRTALVSGYFGPRERVWEEPIYRNVFGQLKEFGDAEMASLTGGLIVEYSPCPPVSGPPAPHDGRAGAAPGKISTPDFQSVSNEVNRAKALLQGKAGFGPDVQLISDGEKTIGPFSEAAQLAFLQNMAFPTNTFNRTNEPLVDARKFFQASERQQRQVEELVEHSQRILRNCESVRENTFWKNVKTPAAPWSEAKKDFQKRFWETIGKIEKPLLPPNARSRQIFKNERMTGYDVVLEVQPDVFAWGVLLLPNDLKTGERRPVVVCQHGLEGSPNDVITTDENTQGFRYYQAFGTRLAERGFVVFVPQNPYRGGDKFRQLQRKANPLGLSIFSFIMAQHQQILHWLGEQPFVDAKRIGFYGLSYGGKTAMRVPAVLDGYALSICSGDFNEWIWKNVSVDFSRSYMFTAEYEMPEWNLGDTFSYAEMAALIAPRPFMVERGHYDGVGNDEQVSYEYAKVRRFYSELGIPGQTEIEYFNGPHQIHGVGTFHFLHEHLNWPEK